MAIFSCLDDVFYVQNRDEGHKNSVSLAFYTYFLALGLEGFLRTSPWDTLDPVLLVVVVVIVVVVVVVAVVVIFLSFGT